ncbi:hypothetical protein [Pseudovibrio sp. Alg231-02]|uniref:hypothetical protein n=1 Tax=Pseudovibrio sp. Alg231-02 TaxID=1922223 RepID=UPI000D558013|nr:hypothetical protein [Pseudovibrio sp. Alg231-02]
MLDKSDQRKASRWLFFGVPLAVCIISGLINWRMGLFAAVFLVLVYLLIAIVSGASSLISAKITKPLRPEIKEAIGVCTFLFIYAALGVALDSKPFIRQYINDNLLNGAQLNLSFIDPVFAGICILGIAAYTWWRIASKTKQ